MTTREEALAAWKRIFSRVQPRTGLRRGLIGDGAGHVEVSGRPGWSWIRYEEEQNRLSMVRCFLGYLEDETPVIVGKWHPEDDYEQVLGVYWGPYSWDPSNTTVANYRVPAHGDTHHGTYGSDPAYIDYANLVMGRCAPTDPESLYVDVQSFVYSYGVETKDFPGELLDLTSEVPGGAGHCYALIYFDPDTESLSYEVSSTVPLAVSPELPALTDVNAIPLGVVRLYNGQTEITIDDTWQRKLLLGSIGGEAVTALTLAVVHEGDVVTNDGEIVWST
jgi:hypothetical protein